LAGVRGRPPGDADAVAEAIVRLSEFGSAMLGRISSIEINPLIVHETGAVGVDVLIETPDLHTPEKMKNEL
jgi:acetate---CoA ligase (ADP-forming)